MRLNLKILLKNNGKIFLIPSIKSIHVIFVERILDLKVKDNSYNEIIDFCEKILKIQVSKENIMDLILEAGKRAKQLNGIYDELVQAHTKILLFDEVFQGRKNCWLGCADAISHYSFLLKDLENRSIETIRASIEGMGLNFDEARLVITDGLESYNAAIPAALESALHVLCQVHAYRIILREQEVYKHQAEIATTALKKAQTTLDDLQDGIGKKNRKLGT